ncbi:MAG: hypothetical protein WA667_26225, partial [Candidatus Nitrosopolaris sp.]
MRLDEESLTSREKMREEEIKIDKAIDRQIRSKQEQEKQEVHKVSVKNLEAWEEEIKIDKAIDRQIRSKQEQEKQEVHK